MLEAPTRHASRWCSSFCFPVGGLRHVPVTEDECLSVCKSLIKRGDAANAPSQFLVWTRKKKSFGIVTYVQLLR